MGASAFYPLSAQLVSSASLYMNPFLFVGYHFYAGFLESFTAPPLNLAWVVQMRSQQLVLEKFWNKLSKTCLQSSNMEYKIDLSQCHPFTPRKVLTFK